MYGYMELEEGNLQEAQALLARGLDILHRMIIDKTWVPQYLEGLAFLAAAHKEWARAAQLLGAADRWRQELNVMRFPYLPDLYAPTRATLLAQLGEATFSDAYSEGRVLTLEQANALALKKDV
jgi:hypothetical protein